MKGHIRKRGNSWAIVLESRDPVTGERKRKWHTFTGDDGSLPPKRAAEAECRRLLLELEGGTAIDATKETVAAFLDRWLEHMQGQVSPRTHEALFGDRPQEPRACPRGPASREIEARAHQ
jgi:hypothetical protein